MSVATTTTSFRDEWAAMERDQVRANELAATDHAAALAFLAELFVASHAEHPQYAGWTDDVVLVQMRTRVSGKGGVRWEAGDVAMSQRYVPSYFGQSGTQVAHAARVGWNVEVGTLYPTVIFDPRA